MPHPSRVASALLLCLGPVAAAQRVSGVVARASDRAPVAGAVVSVVDAAGATAARTITDEHGRYNVLWSETARRLHVVRIGLRPVDATLPPGPARDTTINLAMDLVPALLDTVVVALNPVCPESPDRRAAAQLWEQARAGLLTTIVARDANAATMSILTFERRMDRSSQRVTQQRERRAMGSSSRPFVAGRVGSALVRQGFRAMRGTEELYYAPDADVMFDESFSATHCFSVQRADDTHRGLIGLAFEPTPERKRDTLVDVRGVLWLDPAAATLSRLDFRFTGVNAAAERAGAGGSLRYQAMPNGVAFIDEWTMSIPAVTVGRGVATLIDLTESGGVVMAAKWPDGTLWTARVSAIRGRVVDKTDGTPIPGAILSAEGLVDSTTTDAGGSFILGVAFPGRYAITVTDTTLGHFIKRRAQDREVNVVHGDTAVVDFDMKSRASLLGSVCKGERPAAGTATILGSVADGSGLWPSKLTIESSWLAGVVMQAEQPVSATSGSQVSDVDDTGNFRVCGVTRDRTVRMRVAVGRVRVADTSITVDRANDLGVVTWMVRPDLFDEVQRGDGASISGRVVRVGDGSPIADADVWAILGDAHVRTDTAGQFHLYGLKNGAQLVQVRRIGFAPHRDTITLRPGEEVARQFTLETQVANLDTVRTTAGASRVKYISPSLQAFETRRAQGIGHYVAEAELRQNDSKPLSSILSSHIPGIHLIGYGGSMFLASSRGNARVLADPSDKKSPRGCWVAVYIDGIQIYTGAANDADPLTTLSMSPPAPDMARMPITDFGGVEFYSDANVPAQFAGPKATSCGTLLLWTRER